MTPLQQHVKKWSSCVLCDLCRQRDRIVLVRGTVPCDVLCCGEAPGKSEDALGVPFVKGAPAGGLLEAITQDASRDLPLPVSFGFTNLVACFPREAKQTDNHAPPDESIIACQGRLKEIIHICRPKLIVCVGTLARDWLDPKRRHALNTRIKQIHILHPSFILSRIPKAGQGLAIKKCIVTIRTAIKQLQGVDDVTNYCA